MARREIKLFDGRILRQAAVGSLKKLNPVSLAKNPVIFVTEIGAFIITVSLFFESPGQSLSFEIQIVIWLWLTVIFANFAEALAEGRGSAQANELRAARIMTTARRLLEDGVSYEIVPADRLRRDDMVVVSAGDIIPADGEITDGAASVDESAITGESAPVIRESGGDRSGVTGGTKVLSDRITIRVTSNPGESFLDHMIAIIEGAKRRKTPNEMALTILLSALTLIFLVVILTLKFFGIYSGITFSTTVLVSLLVCLAPTTIGGLISAIGIAGMDRLLERNVLAVSGRAVEAAGDIDVLLLDKTGTITLGNRQATEFIPAEGVSLADLVDAAQWASLADETPEGRSIVVLAKRYGLRGRSMADRKSASFIPFSARTRMSGVDLDGRQIRKGALDAMKKAAGGTFPKDVQATIDRISHRGGTPIVVIDGMKVMGVVNLKDIVKGGLKDRFERLREMGIKVVMITGDNPLTAEAIAKEAGIDFWLAEARPEDKLNLIRQEQSKGLLVAMTGDGSNDAPALAQADVGVAMNTGTQAAKEASNMVDLDSNPTKLIEIVEIGKQLLMTRGSLTTFSIANDVAKYFAIIPALLIGLFPVIAPLNIMGLYSAHSAILSAVIFNALIIIALIPLALRGVSFKPMNASTLLLRNTLVYGFTGIFSPFIGIKLVDLIVVSIGLV